LVESLDYPLVITWIILFILIVIAFHLYVVYPNIKIKVDSWITKLKNLWACKKVKEQEAKEKWTIYIWAYPKRVLLLNIAFILAFFFSLYLYFLTGIWFHLIVITGYVVLIKYLIKWYQELPKIAEEKLKKHEKKLESELKKQIKSIADKVEEILSKEEMIKNTPLEYLANLHFDIIKHPTDIKKLDFPPFIKIPPAKKKVIKSRKMQYFILTRDFIYAALEPTPFDLLNPKRENEKKKCVEVVKVGPTRDYFYSMIRRVFYDKDAKGIRIEFREEIEKPIVMKVAKEADAKPSVFKIKERLRLIERQTLGKVDEIYKFSAIKDALKVSIEQIKRQQAPSNEEESKDSKDKK